MLQIILLQCNVITVGVGISYAAIDEETTAIVIQASATGGVVIVACVFTAAFHYCIRWLNKIHEIEHEVEPGKRRSLKPLGTAVEVKAAHMRYEHYLRARGEQIDDENTRTTSVSQVGDDLLDIPFLEMVSSPDDIDGTDGDPVYLLDFIGGDMMKPFTTMHLQQMSLVMMIILLLSSISFLLGVMACKYY